MIVNCDALEIVSEGREEGRGVNSVLDCTRMCKIAVVLNISVCFKPHNPVAGRAIVKMSEFLESELRNRIFCFVCFMKRYFWGSYCKIVTCTVGQKSHDPCFHKKYMKAGVTTFVAHCTCPHCRGVLRLPVFEVTCNRPFGTCWGLSPDPHCAINGPGAVPITGHVLAAPPVMGTCPWDVSPLWDLSLLWYRNLVILWYAGLLWDIGLFVDMGLVWDMG